MVLKTVHVLVCLLAGTWDYARDVESAMPLATMYKHRKMLGMHLEYAHHYKHLPMLQLTPGTHCFLELRCILSGLTIGCVREWQELYIEKPSMRLHVSSVPSCQILPSIHVACCLQTPLISGIDQCQDSKTCAISAIPQPSSLCGYYARLLC